MALTCFAARVSPAVMRHLGAVLVLVAAAAVAPEPVHAQGADASVIVRGDSIRLRLPGALWLDAHFESWRADVMILEVQGIAGEYPVSIFDLAGLELYGARTPRDGLRHWALLGAVGGVFAGAATGVILHAVGAVDVESDVSTEILATSLRWAGIGALAGTIAGGVYGSARPGIGWIQVRLPNF